MDSSQQSVGQPRIDRVLLAAIVTCGMSLIASSSVKAVEFSSQPAQEPTTSFSELLAFPPDDSIRVSQLLILRDDGEATESPETNSDLDPEPPGEYADPQAPAPENDANDDANEDWFADENERAGNSDEADDDQDDRQAYVRDGRFVLPALRAPSIATAPIGNGNIPKGYDEDTAAQARPLPESGDQRGLDDQPWAWSVTHWAAANTFSHPRYFEDRMLERHGHQRFPKFQPLCSGARFFATVPMLPYLMTLSEPCRCESTLGYFRSGSGVSPLQQRPPYSQRAAVAEAAAITTGVLVFP